MGDVNILFSKEDYEMIEDLQKEFGGELSFTEKYGYIGGTILMYAIPSAALTVQVLDFILTHAVDEKKESKKKKNSKKKDVREERKVEIDGERISIVGYSPNELKIILKSLGLGEK